MACALLIMDAQQEIVERLPSTVDSSTPLARISSAVAAARAAAIPVIWVLIAFRDGYPEVDPRNRVLGRVADRGALLRRQQGTLIHSRLDPRDAEPVIVKRRTDSFSGTDLRIILRSQRIDELVLTGFTTSGVLLSTYLTAVDEDLTVTVLEDACADRDPELHDALVSRLFPSRGAVSTVAAWRESL